MRVQVVHLPEPSADAERQGAAASSRRSSSSVTQPADVCTTLLGLEALRRL